MGWWTEPFWAQQECIDETTKYANACKKQGSPMMKKRMREHYEDCMERKGHPVK
jgi:hypothetical protein